MVNAPGIVLLALLAAGALSGQKIHPQLTALAEPGTRLQVLVLLRHQPQREIVARVEGAAALRTGILEGHWLKLAGQRFASAEQLRVARARLDAAAIESRQAALGEIRDATVLEQQAVEGRLTGLGATRVHGYALLNALAAEVPAEALAALEADPEVAEIVPVEWHEALLDVSPAALGVPAFWSRGITGAGEAVAVLDSGMHTAHPAFAGLNVVSRVFGRYAGQGDCFNDNAESAEDMNGHGTHVAGIVAGRGGPGAPAYLGVARDLGTLYNLKIGFRQKDIAGQCGGRVSSNTADTLEAIEWALFNTPVKVFNYSYGGTAQSDDAPGARLFDYLADVYNVTLTVAAGNDGPGTSTVNSPGIGYNIVAVANYDDRGTIDRADDAVAGSSSRGPVIGGRFKPDVAAPGSRIVSAAHDGDSWVSKTGTSMAAPHVAAAAALMRQAGLTDALALKAVLLNTADGAGWNANGGWGYANLNTASARPYFLRGQAASGAAFYRGRMAADFKATLVWNRHVSNLGSYARSTFSNLGLYLYSNGTGTLLDVSESMLNNVQQVASPAGGEAVLKVKAGTLPQGVTAESYALGISEAGFVSAAPPVLGIRCTAPAVVAAQGTFSVSCEASNTGELDAPAANAEMTVPPGFIGWGTLNFGTVPGGTRVTRVLNFTAPGAAGAYTAPVTLTGNAWGETFLARTSVTFNVGAGPTVTAPSLAVSGGPLSFSHRAGQAAPAAKTVTVTSVGAAIGFTARATASWLRVTPAQAGTPATLSVAAEPGGLAAGVYTGTVMVEAAGVANSPQAVAVTLTVEGAPPASLTVRSRMMAGAVAQGSGCLAPAEAESFVPADRQAYVWFSVGGAAAGDRPSLAWYAPDGSLYQSGQWDPVASAGSWCFWSALDIAGGPPASKLGRWTVKVSWNSAALFSLPFTITRRVTLEARMTTRELAEGSGCGMPDPASAFSTTDARALAWFFVDGAKAGDIPSAQWFQPDGALYRSRAWEPMEYGGKWCFWDSLEIQGAKAAALPGTWTVKAAWNDSALFTLTFTLAPPVVVEQKVMARSLVSGGGCVEPDGVSVFAPTDPRAYLWLSLSGTKAGDRPRAEWYAPSGELYSTVSWEPLESGGNWCLWGWMNIAGQPAAGLFGEWKVRFYWNGAEVFTVPFRMAPAQVENRVMTKETPAGDACTAPPPASSFLTTDPRAVLWFYVRARAEDTARVEWITPAGQVYRRGEWEAVPRDSSRCYWSSMAIAGAPPADMPGAWSVKVYWNGATLFEQKFDIQAPAPRPAAPGMGQARAPDGEAGPASGGEGQLYCGPPEPPAYN